ncbi:MAG: hypothetical protein CEE42_00510 [Promethearchaeota archaeon Loki_b31]|nr:MAG: hypothetical protein CEE42_00510 [Candidatus Lokiarchaeota archaeon Loki_b31]
MVIKFIKKKFYLYFVIVLFIASLNLVILNQNLNIAEQQTMIKTSTVIPHTDEWLVNTGFDESIDPWFYSIEGDSSDVTATFSPGQANLGITGDQGYFSEISGTPTSDYWLNVTNPAFPALPDFHGIDEYGCEVNHTWIDPDDPIQSPSIHWERNITMPVDMSDYVITSASISAVFNATVTTTSANFAFGVDAPNDTVTNPGDYDSARFYVLISDLEDNEKYEVAWYQSIDLGQDSDPEISNILDSFMNTVVEEALIFYLTSLFERDNHHFKVTLGIRIKCVDNFNFDRDRWDSLRIKSCNLSFSYVKKINQFTSVSWNQIGNDISGENKQITGAKLKFTYKIDQKWPTDLSPNSELQILLNNNSHEETLKLNLVPTSFQEAKQGGFNVTKLILKNVNIGLSIKVYLADEFSLNRSIVISIDDVSLVISYIEIRSDIFGEPEIFRLLAIIAVIAGGIVATYFVLYQRIFKYPLPVRKVRKYKKTLRTANPPKKHITSNKDAFNKLYKKELSKSAKYTKTKPASQTIGISKQSDKIHKSLDTKKSTNINNTGGLDQK